jgi:hypothetical protein
MTANLFGVDDHRPSLQKQAIIEMREDAESSWLQAKVE